MTSRISRVAAALIGAGVIGAGLTGFAPASAADPADEFPVLTVFADAHVAPDLTAGQKANIEFTIINIGKVPATLLNVDTHVVSPAKQANVSEVSCPSPVLKPGTGVTCTGTYTLTVADVLRGSVSADVRATGVYGQQYSDAQTPLRIDVDNHTLRQVLRDGSKYAIVNKNSGKVLDVNAQGEIVQVDSTDAASQEWIFAYDQGTTPQPSTEPVNIHNVGTNQLLGIIGGWTGNGATAVQWPDQNLADQSWTFVPNYAEGYYTIVNNNSGKVLGIPAGSHAEGEKAVQWTSEGVGDQKWSLVKIG